MDESLGTLLLCLFLLYWIFIKDPSSPPEKQLDKTSKTGISIFTAVLAVWTTYKLYLAKNNGGLKTNFGLFKEGTLGDRGASLPLNAQEGTATGQSLNFADTVAVNSTFGAPRVLNNRGFWSSGTTSTNPVSANQTEITANALG
mgnify:CR=1 FL=1